MLLKNPGVVFLVVLGLAAAAAPLVAAQSPIVMNTSDTLAVPSYLHFMGTDQFGRDIFSRIVFGARTTLSIGIGSTAAAAIVGIPLGVWAGFRGGLADSIIMRLVDTLLAIPSVLLAMALVAMIGRGVMSAAIAITVTSFPQLVRITRAGTLEQRTAEYVSAAVAAGARDARIVFRTILPNTLSPILVQLPIAVSRAVLLEAGLSFLGLGVQPPQPSWGLMINESRDYMYTAPWYGIFPGVLIALTVLALSEASDRVRRWRQV